MALASSRFNPACAGKKVVLEFEFRLETAISPRRVAFQPPNRFMISDRFPEINEVH